MLLHEVSDVFWFVLAERRALIGHWVVGPFMFKSTAQSGRTNPTTPRPFLTRILENKENTNYRRIISRAPRFVILTFITVIWKLDFDEKDHPDYKRMISMIWKSYLFISDYIWHISSWISGLFRILLFCFFNKSLRQRDLQKPVKFGIF